MRIERKDFSMSFGEATLFYRALQVRIRQHEKGVRTTRRHLEEDPEETRQLRYLELHQMKIAAAQRLQRRLLREFPGIEAPDDCERVDDS
jgi:hypothetical protein